MGASLLLNHGLFAGSGSCTDQHLLECMLFCQHLASVSSMVLCNILVLDFFMPALVSLGRSPLLEVRKGKKWRDYARGWSEYRSCSFVNQMPWKYQVILNTFWSWHPAEYWVGKTGMVFLQWRCWIYRKHDGNTVTEITVEIIMSRKCVIGIRPPYLPN